MKKYQDITNSNYYTRGSSGKKGKEKERLNANSNVACRIIRYDCVQGRKSKTKSTGERSKK